MQILVVEDERRMAELLERTLSEEGHQVVLAENGTTSFAALLRYASRCGVRASAQALARRSGMLRQMFALTVPDDLVRSSITISRRFGTPRSVFRTRGSLYRIYGPNRTIPNGRLQPDSFF